VKHRKQHFVPESYLKAWCDPTTPPGHEPYVWVHPLDRSSPRRKAPANLFYEQDFYTIIAPGGFRDLRLEHGLAELESRFASERRKTLAPRASLVPDTVFVVLAFTAAMQLRTVVSRESIRAEFEPALQGMREMTKWLATATEDEKRQLEGLPRDPSEQSRGLTLEEVEEIVRNPMQTVLGERIGLVTRLFLNLDFAILTTADPLGFVTSDNPCVWIDPEGRNRRPPFQGPALMYDTIEITLPISPSQVLLLNRQGLKGHTTLDDRRFVDEINRRTIAFARESFIARHADTRPEWFL
jgi:hypothetical protein